MEAKQTNIEINCVTNIDEETKKAKELVGLLKEANELIQSLKSVDIQLKS